MGLQKKISFPKELLQSIEKAQKSLGFLSDGELIRYAVRKYLEEVANGEQAVNS